MIYDYPSKEDTFAFILGKLMYGSMIYMKSKMIHTLINSLTQHK